MKLFFVVESQASYTDTNLLGPWKSLKEARENVSDRFDRGLDGDETKYTFFEYNGENMVEVGHVLIHDESFCDGDEITREEHFPFENKK